MSTIGKQNFRGQPGIADAVARSILLGREAGKFFADQGADVLGPEQAYALGASGGDVQWRRAGRRWYRKAVPAGVGLDCLRALDAGLAVADEQRDAEAAAYCGDFGDTDWCGEDFGPMHNVRAALFEAECEQSRQEHAAWAQHECGGYTPDELPLFMVRVKQ